MSLFDDLSPFIKFSMFFGLTPYTVNSTDVKLSNLGIGYSCICTISYGYLVYLRYTSFATSDMERKVIFLTILRTGLSGSVILVDMFLCIVWHRKLRASLILMQRYDRAVKLKATRRLVTIGCWIGLIAIVAYYIWLTWLGHMYEEKFRFENFVTYLALYTAITSGILKFSALIACLLYRFRHLNAIIKSGSWHDAPAEWCPRPLNLRDAWCLHSYLIAAAEELNSLYSATMLLWIAGLTFNIISRIYVICTSDQSEGWTLCRELGMTAAFVFLLTIVAGICHVTAAEANKAGTIAFSPGSRILRGRRDHTNSEIEESIQVGLYFLFRRLRFYAAFGFLRVDLPLLQTIAGAMTTYLVILQSPG